MIYKLRGTLSTGDGIASLDIQDSGFIYGILLIACPNGMDALGDVVQTEVSFMSSNTFAVNDTRGSIAQMCIKQNFLTSGGGTGMTSMSVPGLEVEVSAGERIFLHSIISAGVTGDATAYIYVSDGQPVGKLRPPRRRR